MELGNGLHLRVRSLEEAEMTPGILPAVQFQIGQQCCWQNGEI
jgi:hypothetical protein